MDKDIVPGLLDDIQKDFDKGIQKSSVIKKAKQLLSDKKATYQDVNDYAIEVGEKLSKALQTHITTETLPDGKIYFNIADRVLRTTMTKNHELITEYASEVQDMMNHQAGIKLKPQIPDVDESKVKGIIERVVHEDNFDKIKWILDDPIVTFSQGIVDDTIEKNVEFHAQVGLTPIIIRRASSFCCDWCQALVGSFEYGEEPRDVYRRHGNCRCTVDYIPKGGKRAKDVWSKKERDIEKENRIKSNLEFERYKEAEKFAIRKILKLKEIEPHITQDLMDIAKEYDSQLFGLEYKLKSKESLTRKIVADSKEKKISLNKATSKINDVLRYTILNKETKFTDNYFSTIEDLRNNGYNLVRVKNTFEDGVVYKGVNTLLKKDDTTFELQFHTPKSIDVKENGLHQLYEQQRVLDRVKDKTKWDELRKQMMELSNTIPNPEGVERIKYD